MYITPTVVGDLVLTGSCSGNFYAFDTETGAVRWVYDTAADGERANFHGDPLVADDLIVFGSDFGGDEPSGFVYAVEVATGTLRWKTEVSPGVPSQILRQDDRIYGVTGRGALVCLSLEHGGLLWRADADEPEFEASLRYSAAVHLDRVVFSSRNGWIVAVDSETGRRLWSVELESAVNTELALVEDAVFVGTEAGFLNGIKLTTGDLLPQLDLGGRLYGLSSPQADRMFALVEDVGIVCVNASTGKVQWRQTDFASWSSFRPKVHQGLVWAGNEHGRLCGFAVETGAPIAQYEVHGVIRGFAFSGDRLWIGTLSGTLYACDPE